MQIAKLTARGFTLLEMMVVVGIIAIQALLMVPAYIDRLVRNQVAEALPLADIAKQPIQATWSLARALPADNASIGLPVPGNMTAQGENRTSIPAGYLPTQRQ